MEEGGSMLTAVKEPGPRQGEHLTDAGWPRRPPSSEVTRGREHGRVARRVRTTSRRPVCGAGRMPA